MRIAVVHDYADMFRTTPAFASLVGHEVVVSVEASRDPAGLVAAVRGCEALVLTQQRVALTREVIAQLPDLKFIAQTGRNTDHLDVAACTEHGIVVSVGRRSSAGPHSTTAELAWALILASLRHLPFEVERLRAGHWQSTVGTRLYGRTLGVYAFGHIGAAVARVGRAFGMDVVCWGREGSLARAAAEGRAWVAELGKLRKEREGAARAPAVYAGNFGKPSEMRRFHRGDPMQPREVVAPERSRCTARSRSRPTRRSRNAACSWPAGLPPPSTHSPRGSS